MLTKARYATALCIALNVASAQAPDPGLYSAPKSDLDERRGVMVAMRDGVRLAVDQYMPKTADKLPAILIITPYGRTNLYSQARWFARRGYVFLAADSRGRFDSEGAWDPFDSKHKKDGYELVEWVAGQSWSNGKVGMWGASFSAWHQWWAASTAPPHLAAIVPLNAPADEFEDGPYQFGA